MDSNFDEIDKLTMTLLASQAASAIINARRYDGQVRREFYNVKLLDLCESFPLERELGALSGIVTARARDLFNADRSAIFFVVGHDDEGDAIGERPILIGTSVVQCDACFKEFRGERNDCGIWVRAKLLKE